jgi:putative SOS response-associated peptidase YedK
MCGRFSFSPNEIIIEERFDIEIEEGLYTRRYNCAPSQNLAVISNKDPQKLSYYRWGLIPFWSKDASIGNKMINARAESILEKPSFKASFRQKRCLVLSDGFFEWKREIVGGQQSAVSGQRLEGGSIPYRIVLKGWKLFSMAGIWDSWKGPGGQPVYSFAIITTTPNELMQRIHDRMPVILPRRFEKEWLINDNTNDLVKLLQPFPAEEMETYPVSRLVNSPMNDTPAVIARI